MKIEKTHIYVIFFIGAICLFMTISAALHMEQQRYAPCYSNDKELTATHITKEEVRAFLKTWIKYCEEQEQCPQIPELSYDTADGRNQLDANLTTWLERRGWNVNRFIYIENRLRIIITTILRDKEIMQKQRLMEEGAQNAGNPEIATTLRQAADMQRKSLNIEKITRQEREIVAPQLEEMRNLLNGKYN